MSPSTMNWGQQSTLSCKRLLSALCRTPAPPLTSVLWRVPAGRPQRLPAVRAARWLRLHEGELWITADGRRDAPLPEDWWLSAGQTLRVPPGTSVLMEGWPTASFELLEEPG